MKWIAALLVALPLYAQRPIIGGNGTGGGGGGNYSAASSSYSVGTVYFAPGGSAPANATESAVQGVATVAGTIGNYSVNLGSVPGVGNSMTFTWRKNGASQAVTCQVANTSNSCSDTTHSFTVGAGDLIDIQLVVTGGSVNTTVVMLWALPGVAGPAGGQGAQGPAGAGYGGTSATSQVIPSTFPTTITFTTQSGLAWQPTNLIRATSSANVSNYMEGTVTTYSATTLVISVLRSGGSGTFASWVFAATGVPGPQGPTGATGSVGPSGTGSLPYQSAHQSAITTLTISAATHGQGAIPFAWLTPDSGVASAANFTADSSGNLSLTFTPAFSGFVNVLGGGSGPAGTNGTTGAVGPTGPTGPAGSGNNSLCADATGSTTTYTCPTPTPTPTTLNGLIIAFVPQTTNSASSTVNVAGLGVKTLKQSDCATNLSASALTGGSMYPFAYNGTVFCQLNSAAGGSTAFGTLTSGTNTAAAMVVGAGATLNPASTGVVNANQANGATIPASAPLVGVNASNQIVLASPFATNAQAATYQVLASDFTGYKTITVASGTFTITLVASGSQPATGQKIRVVNYGSGVVTIARSGQNINGSTSSLVLSAASATVPVGAEIVSDGTNYFASMFAANPMTTAGDITYAGANGLPARMATGTAKQLLVAGSTPAYIDFPDFHYFPAANCVSAVAGPAWSSGSTPTPTCRAGTNNKEGYLLWGATDTAQFSIGLPLDWDSGVNPSASIQLASTDATNGHTIIMQLATACAKGDGSVTDDVAFNSPQSFGTITLNGTANREWKATLSNFTMTGCQAGGVLRIQLSRTTDTATSAQIYGVGITIPRLLTVQAN